MRKDILKITAIAIVLSANSIFCMQKMELTNTKLFYSGSQFDILVSNPPQNFTWACSSNVTLSGSGAYSRKDTASSSSGPGWVSVRLNNGDVAKYDFWVNAPVISSINGPTTPTSGYYARYTAIYGDYSGPNPNLSSDWEWQVHNGGGIINNSANADINFVPVGIRWSYGHIILAGGGRIFQKVYSRSDEMCLSLLFILPVISEIVRLILLYS